MTATLQPADVPGLIDDPTGETLVWFAQHVPLGQAIVEIGSYVGKSTAYLASGAGDDVPIYAVDPWEQIDAHETWCQYCDHIHQPTLAEFVDNLIAAGVGDRVTPMQGLSTEVAMRYDGPPIGLLFIDGDHAESAVIADFRAWKPHLAKRAVILFDDYAVTNNPGVARAVAKLRTALEQPIIHSDRLAAARLR